MIFKKAKQNRIFQDVVEQIQEAIISGRLQAGQQLPPERELKEQFNVSRGTLREALRVLEQKGLIEIKTGVAGGAIVRGVSTEQVTESLALLIRFKKVSLKDLAEFRRGIEGDVAAIAARRAGTEDVARLKGLVAKAQQQLEAGPTEWDDFIRTDEEIHGAICEITGNPLFISVLATLYHNIHIYYESYLPMQENILRENHQDMAALVEAITNGNADRARAIAQEHVERFTQHMERQGIS
jgi:DNA-binding FadR family transcriptional regulator